MGEARLNGVSALEASQQEHDKVSLLVFLLKTFGLPLAFSDDIDWT